MAPMKEAGAPLALIPQHADGRRFVDKNKYIIFNIL